jgi:hypothetical protein
VTIKHDLTITEDEMATLVSALSQAANQLQHVPFLADEYAKVVALLNKLEKEQANGYDAP